MIASTERFRSMLPDFIRTFDFTPSRFDREIWMRLCDDKTGYEYICTHVDDFKIVTKHPTIWIDRIASLFLTIGRVSCSYYIGNY